LRLLVLGTLEVRAERQGSIVECTFYAVIVKRDEGVAGRGRGGGKGGVGVFWC
jgi:hypothetical protein